MTLFLDLETTGLDRDARVVEIAVVSDTGDVALQTLIDPGVPIPDDAVAIHGITNEMVRGAPRLESVLPKLRKLLLRDGTLVIFNAEFDKRFLPSSILEGIAVHCAMERLRLVVGRRHSLAQAAKKAGYRGSNRAHRAVADCLACRAVWDWLNANHPAGDARFNNLSSDTLAEQAWDIYCQAKQMEAELRIYKAALAKRSGGNKQIFEIHGVCRITVSARSEAGDSTVYRVNRDALRNLDTSTRRMLFDLGVIEKSERSSEGAQRITFTALS